VPDDGKSDRNMLVVNDM